MCCVHTGVHVTAAGKANRGLGQASEEPAGQRLQGPSPKKPPLALEGSFSFLCLHAAVALTPLLPKAHSLLLTSGTLSPVAPLVAELGLGHQPKRQYPLPDGSAPAGSKTSTTDTVHTLLGRSQQQQQVHQQQQQVQQQQHQQVQQQQVQQQQVQQQQQQVQQQVQQQQQHQAQQQQCQQQQQVQQPARSQHAKLHEGVELVSAPHHHTLPARLLPLTISMAPGGDGQLVKLDSAYERRQDTGMFPSLSLCSQPASYM